MHIAEIVEEAPIIHFAGGCQNVFLQRRIELTSAVQSIPFVVLAHPYRLWVRLLDNKYKQTR